MIFWGNDDKPVRFTGTSKAWHNEGSAMHYVISYCPGRRKWTAKFETATIAEGTLQECLTACDANETSQ